METIEITARYISENAPHELHGLRHFVALSSAQITSFSPF
ncbi:Uncharacterised protein [Klebsiella variicola]|nr:Uncharacterised protein [Klebsiella variicola]